MRTKTRLAAITLVMVALSNQFISCKKESVAGNKVNSNVSTGNSTEKVLSNSLVAWYTFNGDVLDHSGNNNNIDFNSATPTAGKKGVENTAYYFDGSSSYMKVPNSTSLNPTQGITLAAVIKPTGFYNGVCHGNRIISKQYDDQRTGRYLIGYDDQPYYNFTGCYKTVQTRYETFVGIYGDGQGTASQVLDLTEHVKLNKWYTLVYVFDGKYSKFYVDGVLKARSSQPATFTSNNDPLFIGRA